MAPHFRNPSVNLSHLQSCSSQHRGISKRQFGAGVLLSKCSMKQEAAVRLCLIEDLSLLFSKAKILTVLPCLVQAGG